MTVACFGHSASGVARGGGTRLLADPFFSGNPNAEGVATADEQTPDVILRAHARGGHHGDPEARVRSRPVRRSRCRRWHPRPPAR